MNQDFSQKIQKIKEQVNIVDVVGQYLKLTRKGNNFWAICPFHQDSNPSLSVSQDKQIYKCFSCGEQGNVFVFLQKYKKLDFLTAVKEVADFAKIDLAKLDLNLTSPHKVKLHPFKILNNLALNFYQYQMTTDDAKQALDYLKSRKITDQNINDFALGFAPNKNQLLEYLKMQGYQTSDIIAAGLAKITDQDQIKDMFFNRIIFPIIDLDGECLGFSARSFNQNSGNLEKTNFKYVNTPETEIFKKGRILYNLYNAKNSLTANNNNKIYLVEGYMDVISLSNQNINNCVALMGTNLTKDHLTILKQFTNDIIIFLDGDEPGKQAAIKIATSLLAQGFNVKVIDNHTNQDPDELIKHHLSEFKAIINTTLHPFDFAIKYYQTKYDLQGDSYQLKEFLRQLKRLWNAINDPITTKFYLDKLKKLTNLTDKELFSVLKESELGVNQTSESKIISENYQYKQTRKNQLPRITLNQKYLELQKQLFFLLLLDSQVFDILEKEKFIFTDQRLMNFYLLVAEKYQREKLTRIDLNQLLDSLKDNDLFSFLQAIVNQYQNKNYQVSPSIIEDYIKNIENCQINLKVAELMKQIVKSDDQKVQMQLLQQMSILKNKLKK